MTTLRLTVNFSLFCAFILFACIDVSNATSKHKDWAQISDDVASLYSGMDLADLQLSYVDNLKSIKDIEALTLQAESLEKIQSLIKSIKPSELGNEERMEFLLLKYDLLLQQQRLPLEMGWHENRPKTISELGIATIPNGKAWYRYFLKRWVDMDAKPEELFNWGIEEVERVKSHITKIQTDSSSSRVAFYKELSHPRHFLSSAEQTMEGFENTRNHIDKVMSEYFVGLNTIPKLNILQGKNKRLAQTPGYYNANTFYFNFFDVPYKKRQMAWLYLHEAFPGHHYQISLAAQRKSSDLRQVLGSNSGFVEGWAAYVEDLAIEVGAYPDTFSELGKWEWDLVRSVRVPLDIGLNYYGWEDAQAMAFWKKHVIDQDHIGRREIARMRRWPAQVITYKHGARELLKMKALCEQQAGFDYKNFHASLLEQGPIPMSILLNVLSCKL